MGNTKNIFHKSLSSLFLTPADRVKNVLGNVSVPLYHYFLAWLLMVFTFSATKLDAQNKSGNKGLQTNPNTIYMQATYGSKTGTFGTFENEVNQPSVSGTLTYISPINLDLNLSQYAINNSDDSLEQVTYETDLSIGYKQYFGKKIYAYGTYMHSFYSANSSLMRSQFSNQAGIETGFEGKYLNPSISGILLLGNETEFILDLQQIFQFDLLTSRTGNTSLTVFPAADLMMGKLQFYNEYLLQQYRNRPWRFIYYYHVRQGMTRAEIEDMLETEQRFTVSSLNMSLPVTVTAGNWILTASANFLKPFNQQEILGNEWIFYFTGSAGYMLSW